MKGINGSSFIIEGNEFIYDKIYCYCSRAGIKERFLGKLQVTKNLGNNKIEVVIITNNPDVYYIERKMETKTKNNLVVYILQGPPAGGKSTWARKHLESYGSDKWVIINRDSIRNSLGDYWILSREDLVTDIEHESLRSALGRGYNVIYDSTNLNKKYLNKVHLIISEAIELLDVNITTTLKEFNPGFEECVRRDALRDKPVGKSTIKKFFNTYYPAYRNKVDPRISTVVFNPQSVLKRAVIFDIDGTLALMNGRDPFIGEDCASDIPNLPIIEILNMYSKLDYEVILFSGRNGGAQLQTEIWLNKNGIHPDQLHMRVQGNFEKDTTIKRQMYEEYVKDKYSVHMIYDDRDVVVDMWREELNLPCCQVYYGSF